MRHNREMGKYVPFTWCPKKVFHSHVLCIDTKLLSEWQSETSLSQPRASLHHLMFGLQISETIYQTKGNHQIKQILHTL